MEEVYLVLYLKEEGYGKRLQRFLAGKKNPKLHLELITEREQIEIRLQREEVVVITDDMSVCYRSDEEGEKRKIWYLTTEQNPREGKIYQYQKAEAIYENLIELLRLEKQEIGEELPQIPTGIYGVFSLEGKERTEFSRRISQYLGKQGKTLYLCLSGFPMYLPEEVDCGTPGLSDLLFLVQDEEFPEKVNAWKQEFGTAQTFLPWKHVKDMWDISVKEWELLFRRLQEECKYLYIVIEIGELFEQVWEVMDFCDKPFFLLSKGEVGQRQKEIFQRYCHMEQKEALEKRTEYKECSEQSWEEEDVCVLEGFE